jgi:hypothetical protein
MANSKNIAGLIGPSVIGTTISESLNVHGCAMRTTKPALGSALLALFFMAMATLAHADGVYKWVDENGHAHYSDKPPKQGEHTQLRAPAAPSAPQNEAASTEFNLTPKQLEQQRQNELDTKQFQEAQRERDRAAQEQARASQKRYNDNIAESKSKDAELIEECKRNREIYCDQGVEKIKREQEMRLIDEEEERKRRISGRDRYRY